jgi:hypothetical protein
LKITTNSNFEVTYSNIPTRYGKVVFMLN